MRGPHVVRALRWVILVLPGAAFAQIIIDPPGPHYGPLGPPPQPAGNVGTPAKENLGKALFWDEQLSSSRTVACGTCHHASEGGIDPRGTLGSPRAMHPGPDGIAGTSDDIVGSPGVTQGTADGGYVWSPAFGIGEQVTRRRALSHINSGYPFELFWDGRARGPLRDPLTGDTLIAWGAALEIQALAPPLSTVEMGHLGRDWNDATARIAASVPLALATDIPAELETWLGKRGYPELFNEAFGTPGVTPVRIAMAIASYERTLFSNQTPLDSALAGIKPLTGQEESGHQVFEFWGRCGGCHRVPLMGSDAMFNTGVRPAHEDSGRWAVTRQDYEMGSFRSVSLRNVGLRHSFMHNGRFQTLEEVVDFYDRGGDFNSTNPFRSIGPLGLTPQQKQDLLAFLRRPLTDPRVAAALPPFDEPRLYSRSDRMPKVLGGGVPGIRGIPQVVAREPPVAGNPAFTVGIYDGRTGAEAVLVIDDTEPPTGAGIPAGGSLARISTTLMGAAADDGFGSVTLAIPAGSGIFERTYFGRWYVVDPAAVGGVAESPSFRISVFAPRGALKIPVPFAGSSRNAVQVHPASPNPFVSSTIIRYELFVASPVTLTIYDLNGRAVRTLVHHPMQSPGPYAVEWDGRDGYGRVLAGAVYFSRLDAAGTSRRFSVVRVR